MCIMPAWGNIRLINRRKSARGSVVRFHKPSYVSTEQNKFHEPSKISTGQYVMFHNPSVAFSLEWYVVKQSTLFIDLQALALAPFGGMGIYIFVRNIANDNLSPFGISKPLAIICVLRLSYDDGKHLAIARCLPLQARYSPRKLQKLPKKQFLCYSATSRHVFLKLSGAIIGLNSPILT